MEKAAEVYTCLKSRVLGPKVGANQKVNKTDPEKDKGEGDKGKEKLPEGETENEAGEEQASAGKYGGQDKVLYRSRQGGGGCGGEIFSE